MKRMVTQMKNRKCGYIVFVFIFCFIFSGNTSFAHSGRTDSSGGHHDYKNKSGLGSYHYHHGYGPHLHEGGVCPYEYNDEETYEPPSPSISLNKYPKSLNIGESSGVEFSVENATSDETSIKSSNKKVAVINSDNTITAKGEGISTITIKSSGVSSSFKLVVKSIPVSKVNVKNKIETIQVGESYKLKVKVSPSNASNKKISWKSDNKNIVSVDKKGVINAKAEGTANISCTSTNGIKDGFVLKVYEVFPQEIITNFEKLRLELGQTENLEIQILPENANNKNCNITIDCEDVVQIDDNMVIKAIKDGNAKLTIKTNNNIIKEIPIEIFHNPVKSIIINDSDMKYLPIPFLKHCIYQNTRIRLAASVRPKNATIKDIKWESTNSDIIEIKNNEFKINGTGKVLLIAYGNDYVSESFVLNVVGQSEIVSYILILLFVIAIITVLFCKKKKIIQLKQKAS